MQWPGILPQDRNATLMARKSHTGSTKLKLKTGILKQRPDEDKINRAMHQRGYELWRAGLSPTEIQKRLHISRDTWSWILKVGSTHLPAYEDLVVDEVSKIRSSASEAALEISESSVHVLRDRMTNAGKANTLMSEILDRAQGEGGFKPGDTSALKALLPIANITTVAEAYARIYGASAAMRGLHPTVDHAKAEFISPLETVQGKTEENKALMPPEQQNQVVSDVSKMTDKQIRAYLETGKEPDPSEVVDS